ncbi:PrsW family intramembrane metalloprotease [Halosegnis sp.]|uniref:PrsW family intramembrane metalloprotease n=1 Tax=Halosegnis sp. TaxID=2864959 RepID=UPI0035D41CDF
MTPRKLLRVARWEATKGVASVDRRVAAVLAALLVVTLASVPALAATGLALDEGIYRVGIEEESPLYGPVAADTAFTVQDPSRAAFEDGRIDLLVTDGRVRYRDTEKGRAAVAQLQAAVERYNDRRLAREPNQTAAFPVRVTLRFIERGEAASTPGEDTASGSEPSTPTPTAVSGGGGSGSSGSGGAGSGAVLPGVDLFGGETTTGSPSDIAPPFPFESLVLAFLFVLPLNFVIQAYGSSMLKERLNRRGELLLVAPLSRGDIVGGKTLPYLLVALAVTGGVAVAVGGGLLSMAGVVPLALLFLAATFLAAMFARSFRELTFLTVAVSVGLTTYAFVPAVFSEVQGVALVSPLTLVVRDLTGESVALSEAAVAVGPPTLTAAVCYGFGLGLYREEDLFTQRPVPLKLLDALASRISRARSLVFVTALVVPFVFVTELLAVATLFALPVGVSIPVVLALVAVVEELAKSAVVLAGFEHARYPKTPRWAVVGGAAAGLGFFLGEKLTLVVQLVGLPELRVGAAAFGPPAASVSPLVLTVLLIAPLGLHVLTTTIAAIGATRGREGYLTGLALAVAVHLAYNGAVLAGVGVA